MHTRQTISEKQVENYLVDRVRAAGGVAEKTASPGRRGYFDRVVALPGGRVIFVEVKKPRGWHMPLHQRARHKLYRDLGCEVAVVKTIADVDSLIDRPGGVDRETVTSKPG